MSFWRALQGITRVPRTFLDHPHRLGRAERGRAASRLRGQLSVDFAPPWALIPLPPSEVPTATCFMYGMMNGEVGAWVRDKKEWAQLVPPADYSRTMYQCLMSWGVRSQEEGQKRLSPRHGAWLVPVSGNRVIAEVFELLSDEGKILSEFSRLRVYEHSVPGGTYEPAVMAPAERYGVSPDKAYSDTPYRVDRNDGQNSWLTVGSFVQAWHAWYYDLEGGTPAGFYDLRPVCQNTSYQGEIGYPPPPKRQSQIVPGSSDVGCLRWVVNPGWNPANPLSPRYTVNSYWYSINEDDAPDGCPLPLGSTWDSVAGDEGVLEVKRDRPQWYFFEPLGATWHEDAETLVYLLRETMYRHSEFRYLYPCEFTTVRKGVDPTTDPGRIYQVESKTWSAFGVRVYQDGVMIRDDAPEGIREIGRANEEPVFPSAGGDLELISPAPNSTLRGFRWATNSTVQKVLWPIATGRADGDFYVLVTDEDSRIPENDKHYLARAAGVYELPGMHVPGAYWEATIREVDGRVWVLLNPIIGV